MFWPNAKFSRINQGYWELGEDISILLFGPHTISLGYHDFESPAFCLWIMHKASCLTAKVISITQTLAIYFHKANLSFKIITDMYVQIWILLKSRNRCTKLHKSFEMDKLSEILSIYLLCILFTSLMILFIDVASDLYPK